MVTRIAAKAADGEVRLKAPRTRYLLLGWIVLAYPLTWLGYGSDPDAWRLARAAARKS